MKTFLKKPYFFFFGLALIMLISSFIKKDLFIDVTIFSIYYIIDIKSIELISFVYFILVGLNYFMLHWIKRKPILWLTIVHILFQISALVLLFTKNSWNFISESKELESIGMETDNSNVVLVLSILLFIISFFVHFLNFIIAIFLKRE